MQEHIEYIHIAICGIAILLMFMTSAFLSMFSFAVASYKCSSLSDFKKKEVIDATAKRLLYSSNKISSIVYLAKRFALIIVVLAMYCMFELCCSIANFQNIAEIKKLACFLPIAMLAMWFQHSVFDLTAIKIGKSKPEEILIKYSRLFYFIYILMMPFYFLTMSINKKITKLFKIKSEKDFENIDVELMLTARESDSGSISQYTSKIVKNAIKLQELDVSDVMLPRSKVKYIDIENTNAENLELARTSQHTRFPLCKGNLDDCYGIIHIKDIFTRNLSADEIDFMRLRKETIRIRENEKLESALLKLLKYKLQMAIVEDEFGGVIGVLTLDAALSELVGQIKNEFSSAPQELVRRMSKNKYKIMGLASLHRVEDFLDVDFDADDVSSTFGGLITYRLGRFPEEGEQIHLKKERLRIKIDKVDERAVKECTVLIEENEETE